MASTAEVIVTLEDGARVIAEVAGHRIATDQPVTDGGENTAPSPYILFLGSLATCAGYFVSSFCRKRGLSTDGLRIRQHVENDPVTGVLARVEHQIELPPDFPQKYVSALSKVVEGCSVKRAIQAQPIFHSEIHVADASASQRQQLCFPPQASLPPDGARKCYLVRMVQDERSEWERAQAGDRSALDSLLRRHEKQIYRFGLRMCGDEDAAREVLQRTLLSAFEQLSSFRGDARISTWLYTLARSQCSRLHRRGRSAPVHDLALDAAESAPTLAADEPAPDAQSSQTEMAQLVATAISLLPENHREAVVLKDVEDLSLEEAARITGLAVPAFKSRLHRARERLKSNLATLLHEKTESRMIAACPELQHTLRSIREQEIDRAACSVIETHLRDCAACRDHFGPLRDAATLCRHLPTGDVPLPVQRAVRTALVSTIGTA